MNVTVNCNAFAGDCDYATIRHGFHSEDVECSFDDTFYDVALAMDDCYDIGGLGLVFVAMGCENEVLVIDEYLNDGCTGTPLNETRLDLDSPNAPPPPKGSDDAPDSKESSPPDSKDSAPPDSKDSTPPDSKESSPPDSKEGDAPNSKDPPRRMLLQNPPPPPANDDSEENPDWFETSKVPGPDSKESKGSSPESKESKSSSPDSKDSKSSSPESKDSKSSSDDAPDSKEGAGALPTGMPPKCIELYWCSTTMTGSYDEWTTISGAGHMAAHSVWMVVFAYF